MNLPSRKSNYACVGCYLVPVLVLALSCGSSGTNGAAGGSGAAPSTGGTSTGGAGGTTGGTGGSTGGTGGTGGASGGTGGATSGSGGATSGTGGSGGASAGSSGAGSGGASGSGGSGTGGTSAGAFTLKVELSTAIPTVGIATFSVSSAVDSAVIDFGRDQSAFEFQAPVDAAADMHRTLLLGMKPDTTYYARVTAKSGAQTLVSDVASFRTGYLPNGLPVQMITDHDATALYAGGGFTVACTGYDIFGGGFGGGGTGGGATGSWAWIFDRDGDPVWAFDLATTSASACTRARMSYDGKYLWAGNFGNTTSDGALTRLSMDGLGTPDNYSLPGRSHDFAILPNEHVVYFARNNGGSDQSPESIRELDPATSTNSLIYDELTDFSALISTRGGHTNQVNYVPELEAISFSMYFADTVALVSYPEGKLLAAFGGDNSTFSGMSWSGQHGHDVRADHVDIFNNNGTNGGASVLRFQYDLTAKTAAAQTDYSSGLDSPAFGDVKEQPNGNFFVTYSIASVMHELDPSLKLLREIQTSVAIAYVEHRATLYGKPPPYDR